MRRTELLAVLALAEFLIRRVASRWQRIPARDRAELLRIANMLADVLRRAGQR